MHLASVLVRILPLSLRLSAAIKNFGLLLLAASFLVFKTPPVIDASSTVYQIPPSAQSESSETLSIPAIGLSAKVVPTGLGTDGLQEVPKNDVGRYKFGPQPGENGNVVLVGHTPGIFSNLTEVNPGDKIEIDTLTYQVTQKTIYQVDRFPTKQIYGPAEGKNLILITCHGLSHRLVIEAKLLPIAY